MRGACACPKRWDRQRYGFSRVCDAGWTMVVRHAVRSPKYGATILRRGRVRWYGEHGDLAKAKRMATRVHRHLCSKRR